jgi:hypothetical protein
MENEHHDKLTKWRFSRTISLDSLIVILISMLSGLLFVVTLSAKVDEQGKEIQNVQKLLERVESDQKERSNRIEHDQAERSNRLEAAIKEQSTLVQNLMMERLKR